MSATDFDAIVVGSGVSGGWAAKELTEAGLKVLLLDRGRRIVHGDDYVTEHKAPWEFPFRGLGDRRKYKSDYRVQRLTNRCDETGEHFFVNDRENPYRSDPAAPFAWIRGYQLGGRSLTWTRVTPRWGEINFAENARDGLAPDWPIRYADISKWYDHVEDFAGISGQTELDFPTLPSGKYLPPMPLTCIEEHAAKRIAERFADRRLVAAPVAVLTRDHRGRAACHYCGPCYRGCSTGSYFSSLSSTLPAAEATGNLTTVTDAIVAGLDYDPRTKRVTGVRTIDAKTRAGRTYRGRIVFLNASTLGSTQILLASRSEAFPNGLANSSGVLGHYLMDHVMGPEIVGKFDLFGDRAAIGHRPGSFYIPRFQNIEGQDAPFRRGYAFQGISGRLDWRRGATAPGFGAEFKKSLRRPGQWTLSLEGFGECLPYRHNRVELDEKNPDGWGMPQLKISFTHGENERRIAADMIVEGEAIMRAIGAVETSSEIKLNAGGAAIHEMGTARMGRDPATSVLNAFNQAHDVPNLFVTDGACMASGAAQNPSLTYMALTARAADHAVRQMKAGAI